MKARHPFHKKHPQEALFRGRRATIYEPDDYVLTLIGTRLKSSSVRLLGILGAHVQEDGSVKMSQEEIQRYMHHQRPNISTGIAGLLDAGLLWRKGVGEWWMNAKVYRLEVKTDV